MLLLFAVLYCLPILLKAQEQLDGSMMQRIKDEEEKNSQVVFIAHNLTDVTGPRLTNSPGYKRAVSWSVETLNKWGLRAAPEAWGEFGKGWANNEAYIVMKAPYFQTLIGYPKAWTKGTNGLVTANIVLLDRLDSAAIKAKGDSLRGKIVLIKTRATSLKSPFEPMGTRFADSILNKMPNSINMIPRAFLSYYVSTLSQEYRTQKILQSAGVVALLSTSPGSRDGTVAVEGTQAFAKGYDEPMPQIVLAAEDYLTLQRLALDKAGVQLALNIKNTWYTDDLNGYNVIGEIPGTDARLKEQVVMLGAHLDSWHSGTGATDNAAGCIVMMEAVRILKALGVEPRRTIRIALWGGEEQGLLGSFGYVKKHYGDPKDMKLMPEQKNVSVYFNLDNGSGKIRGIFAQGNDSVKSIFSEWLKPFNDMGATGVTKSSTGATDHLSFDAVGIPGFQFIQDPLEYDTKTHHTNMDVYDHLYIDDLKQAAQIVAAFIYNAAMRDEMIPRKPLPKAERFVFDTDAPL